jgi:hypothetical protein
LPADAALRLPDFVVLGPPKTATTTLHRWFEHHPQVFLPEGKEPHFFDVHWSDGVDSYAALFSGAGEQQVVGEVASTYLAHRHAPDRLAATLPGARCIAVLRDPADRAWSHYWMQQANWAVSESFEAMMGRQMADVADVPRGHGAYLDAGRYATHLARWDALIGRERMLVLFTDDIRDRPEDVYRELCAFVGVDAGYEPPALGQRYNVTRPVRSPRARRAMLKMHVGKWLPKSAVTKLDDWNRQPSVPEMPAAIRTALVEWYRPELDALASWLGRPLPASWLQA